MSGYPSFFLHITGPSVFLSFWKCNFSMQAGPYDKSVHDNFDIYILYLEPKILDIYFPRRVGEIYQIEV